VTKNFTFAFDYLGQTLLNAPRVFGANYPTKDIPGGTGTLNLPTITGGTDSIGVNSASVGMKYDLFGKFLLTSNILFRLDSRGLRQDVMPLVALSYAFGK
jgi:hypothetical protein